VDEEKLLDLAFQIVVAEERARLSAKSTVTAAEVAKTPSTYVVDRRDITLRGEETVVSSWGSGVLQEFVAKAEDTDFQVLVERDGEKIIRNNYSGYAEISQDIEGVDTFAERDEDGNPTGAYVFKVNDVEFTKSLTVTIRTSKPVRFRAIFCRYKVAEA
jgi:hypothetical protein